MDRRVAALLEPLVEQSGHVLEAVTITPAGRRRVVRVVVDLPAERTDGLDLDAVALVSRDVADALDGPEGTHVLGGSPYVLEVTSPGVDRPLTERRHWSRARGRLVTVPVGAADGGGTLTGRVGSVADDGVVLTTDGVLRTVAWASLGAGRVQVELNRPTGGPEDPRGKDGPEEDGTDEEGEG